MNVKVLKLTVGRFLASSQCSYEIIKEGGKGNVS